MTGRLDGLQAVATRLIEDFGAPATLTSETVTFDVATGKNVVSATSSTDVIMTPPAPYNKYRMGNTTVETGDLMTMLTSAALPEIGHKIVFESATWQIVSVAPIYAGTVIAAFEVQLRK